VIAGRSAATAGAAVIALVLAIGLQVARDRSYSRDAQQTQSVLYVQSGELLKRVVLDFDALASDLYWIRAIQHYGGQRLRTGQTRDYSLLYPLLDITTSLDPYFTIAYRFGAIFLSEEYPGGPGRPDQAIALLEKGMRAEPHKWQYPHDIAFVHYWRYRDLKAAATWFGSAADQPGAPNWLRPLVASMLSAGGERSGARMLWTQMLNADQQWLRRTAAKHLRQLDALDQLDQLDALIAQAPPPAAGERYSWEYLVRLRVIRGIPLDPVGVPYDIDPQTGKVSVAARSDLQPMPRAYHTELAPK
jgi:hypothetical protein